MLTNQQSFQLHETTLKMDLSIFDSRLLFLHGVFCSSQLLLDGIAVLVMEQPTCCKLQLMFRDESQHSIGLYFDSKEFDGLVKYFIALGFPKHLEVRHSNDWTKHNKAQIPKGYLDPKAPQVIDDSCEYKVEKTKSTKRPWV